MSTAPRPTRLRRRVQVHQCPPDGVGAMPCCGRSMFDVPRSDRVTTDADQVTCTGAPGRHRA